MSVYPRFSTSGSKNFNARDIISYEEAASGQTIVSLDLSSFVQKSAPVFESELYLKEGVGLNMNGTKQSTAFTDDQKLDVETSKSKLSAIEYSESKTIINDLFDLTNSILLLLDDQIDQSKIAGLITRLAEIDANLESIISNDEDILALKNITTAHTDQLAANDVVNAAQTDSIVNLRTDTENIAIRVSDTESDIVLLNAQDVSHDASLILLNDITLTLTNDVIDLKQVDDDMLLNLNNYKTSNDGNVLLINNELDVIDALIIEQNTRLTDTETVNVSQTERLDAIETVNVSQTGRLDNIETKNDLQDISISALDTLTTSHISDLAALIAFRSSSIENVSILQNDTLTQSSQIATLDAAMLTKHAIINNLNKLNTAYIGNGDVSNLKLSALNDVRVDVSIQSQLNSINSSISGLDALQDLDLVSIPLLQTNVSNLVAKDLVIDASLTALASDIETNVFDIASNASGIATNVSDIATANTAITNNNNSISTINNNLTALANADVIHSSQITDLQASDILLQTNINLKENLISLSNKLSSTKIFDTVLNDSLDNILTTVDSNITILNSNKQNNITNLNKLNSSLLNRNDNLSYIDITSGLQAQLTAINNSISTLQGITNNDTIFSFQTIEDNFDTLDLTKLDKTVYDNTIAPEIVSLTNAISTLQSLQNGDVVSFNSINSSLTNLTNTKHSLITLEAKLPSSLLNRDDSLQYVDVSSSIQTKLNSLDSDIATKQNVINAGNKLEIANVDFGLHPLSYVDITSGLQSKLDGFNSQIGTLTATDVAQTLTNTNLQNTINTNATSINDLVTFETAQGVLNTEFDTSLVLLKNSVDSLAVGSLLFTTDDVFSYKAYEANMPSYADSTTNMLFQIDGEDYRLRQGSYVGIFYQVGEGLVQNKSHSVQNLFNPSSGAWRYHGGYYNSPFYNDDGVKVQFDTRQYDITTGLYIRTDHQITIDSVIYGGEFLEFHYPFHFAPTALTFESPVASMPLKSWLLGSNNGIDYEFIAEMINDNSSQYVSHTITNSKKYKILRFVVSVVTASTFGFFLDAFTLAGSAYDTLIVSTEEQIIPLIADIATNTASIVASNIANTNSFTTLQDINTAQALTNTANTNSFTALQDINTAQALTNTANTNSFTALQDINTAQALTNTANTNSFTSLQDINTAQALTNTANTNSFTTLQTNIDAKAIKIENTNDSLSAVSDILDYTFNEENIFMNALTSNNLTTLNLTLDNPTNNKTYVQKVYVNAEQYKTYVNVLKINDVLTEIKYVDGIDNTSALNNLQGYGMILQTLNIVRNNNTYFVTSDLQVFYNTISNAPYDITPPLITLIDANMTVEINTSFTEPGFTCTDNINGDLVNEVVITGVIDLSVLGTHYKYYNCIDAKGNIAIEKIRIITVSDTITPLIVLVGEAEITISSDDTYVELGANVSDNSNEVLNIVISGVVNNILGDYFITYSSTDSSENNHNISRLIHVVAPVPSITNVKSIKVYGTGNYMYFAEMEAFNQNLDDICQNGLTTVTASSNFSKGSRLIDGIKTGLMASGYYSNYIVNGSHWMQVSFNDEPKNITSLKLYICHTITQYTNGGRLEYLDASSTPLFTVYFPALGTTEYNNMLVINGDQQYLQIPIE